jgi:hypothetical protein
MESKETYRNQGCSFDGMTKTTVMEKVHKGTEGTKERAKQGGV